ncbi:MAG: hypothetical protein H7839_11825 [Magnetococcus sp. YQC-5]
MGGVAQAVSNDLERAACAVGDSRAGVRGDDGIGRRGRTPFWASGLAPYFLSFHLILKVLSFQPLLTFCRLIIPDSIEEKIIAMHWTKRDLADSLLEGTESVTRISEEELLALLRD